VPNFMQICSKLAVHMIRNKETDRHIRFYIFQTVADVDNVAGDAYNINANTA